MTSFLDVIRPLTDQLKAMSSQVTQAVPTYTSGTTTFRNHTSDVGNLSSPIHFMGQGANAFIAAVNHNADLSTRAITRLSDFQAACDDAWKTMENMSGPYDSESRYLSNVPMISEFSNADPYTTYEFQYFLDAQGYTTANTNDPRTTITWRIREDTLPGLSFQLDTLLSSSSGPGLLEGNISQAVSYIQNDFQRYQLKRHSILDGALQNKEISKDQHTYYSAVVDSTFKMAMNVVNAIAKNMTTGYTTWDEEFIAAANNFLVKVNDIDTGQLAQLQLYNTIDSKFHDPRTQALLYSMLTSPYGAKVVQYLLNTADCRKMSPCGDALIVWQDGMPPNTGAFNNGTVITLNMQEFTQAYDPNNPSALANLAGELAHESVETYYSRAYDIPANTLPMDYLADYIRQIVSTQMNGQSVGFYPSYQSWVTDPQNAYVKDFHENGDPGGDAGQHVDKWWWNLWNSPKPNFAGNPMGLDPSLLQNNSTKPGWDITQYWDPNTSTFHFPAQPTPHPQPGPSPTPQPTPIPTPSPQPTPSPSPQPQPSPPGPS